MPDAESDLQTFEGRDGPELHLKQIGFQGIGKIFAYPSDRQLSKMGVKMSLSPDRVKYSQSSVVKGHVKTILENGSKTSETDPLLVVKEGENYYLQGGHHRAAASILQSGKFTATVIEKVGKKWTKPEEPTANALGGAKKGGSGGK